MRRHSGRHRPARLLLMVAVLLVAGIAFALMWRPAIAPLPAAAVVNVDAALVGRGARLAAFGQCASCHTADPAAPFAGGVSIATPFGAVVSTNITPDRATGIGAWTAAAFARAMGEGVSRDGHHLYPAFPYNHYARLRPDDVQALYAFMMTRDPLNAPARENSLHFPFNFRPLVAGWNLLYLDHSEVRPVPERGVEWNRGAYLADALGHCSACHSPRNALGAEDKRRYLGGGEAEGWYVPALNVASPSPLPWSVDHLDQYLRTGIAPGHAIAGGPMQGVTANLGQADPADVRALAVYISAQMGKPPAAVEAVASASLRTTTPMPSPAGVQAVASVSPRTTTPMPAPAGVEAVASASLRTTTPMPSPAGVQAVASVSPRTTTPMPAPAGVEAVASASLRTTTPMPPVAAGDGAEAQQLRLGGEIYASTCARCHDGGRATGSGGALQLPAAIALYDPDPRSLLRIIREGVLPADGAPGRWMPGFAGTLDAPQLTALAAYLRQYGAHQRPWPNLAAQVQKVTSPQ